MNGLRMNSEWTLYDEFGDYIDPDLYSSESEEEEEINEPDIDVSEL